ncbi:unnamed protein product, partial [Allacma fusca]
NAQKVNECSNVTFEVSPAEKLNVPDGSVQLITAMAAAHCWPRNPSKNEAIQKAYDEVAFEGLLRFHTTIWLEMNQRLLLSVKTL